MVVPAPIPNASVRIANRENPGFARLPRMPYRKSCQSECMVFRRRAGMNVPGFISPGRGRSLVGTGRFDLATCRLGGGTSIQLSYVHTHRTSTLSAGPE